MAERHDSTNRGKAVLKPVVKWESGWAAVGSRGGSSRGGWWDFQGAVQVQVRCKEVDGRGWCSGSTCLGRDWTGLGLGLETAELPGDRGQEQGGTGTRLGRGDPLWQGRGRCSAAAQRGCSKKGDGMGKGQAQSRWADGR